MAQSRRSAAPTFSHIYLQMSCSGGDCGMRTNISDIGLFTLTQISGSNPPFSYGNHYFILSDELGIHFVEKCFIIFTMF